MDKSYDRLYISCSMFQELSTVQVLWSGDVMSLPGWQHVLISVESDLADFVFQGKLAARKR